MELRPILSAMLRNKTGAILVGLQIALTLAVVANAVFIIMQRVEKIGRPPGIDSDNLIFVQSYGFGPNYDQRDTVRRDLDMIRALPGVVARRRSTAFRCRAAARRRNLGAGAGRARSVTVNANYYEVDEHGVDALGVKLVEGRDFTRERDPVQPAIPTSSEFVPVVIITHDMANAHVRRRAALGKTVYDGLGQSAVVVGVIENMLGAWVDWDKLDAGDAACRASRRARSRATSCAPSPVGATR